MAAVSSLWLCPEAACETETTPEPSSAVHADFSLGIEEITLDNGFRLLLVQRSERRTIEAGWVVAAGSADEEPGETGVAHLLEHALFDGTGRVGTLDPDRERSLLAEEDRLQALLSRTRTEGGGDPDDLIRVERDLSALSEQLTRVAQPQAFLQLYAEAGGRNLNASTVEDLTLFYVTLPPEALELWFWLESDRLLDPVFRAFYSERDVVAEERRQRIDSSPTGQIEESLRQAFWGSHPYGRSTLGLPSDVADLPRSAAERFFRQQYRPDALTAVLIGPVDRSQVESLARRYFGRLASGAATPGRSGDRSVAKKPTEPDRQAAGSEPLGRVEGTYNGPPLVRVLYPTVPVGRPDEVVLDVLAGVLNGRSGRFHRELALEDGDVFAAYASHRTLRRGGQFSVTLEGREGSSPETLLEAWDDQAARLIERPVPAGELQAVKNRMLTERLVAMNKSDDLLKQLLVSAALGDYRRLEHWGRRVQAVTVADLLAAADRYFSGGNRTVGLFGRTSGTADETGSFIRSEPAAGVESSTESGR